VNPGKTTTLELPLRRSIQIECAAGGDVQLRILSQGRNHQQHSVVDACVLIPKRLRRLLAARLGLTGALALLLANVGFAQATLKIESRGNDVILYVAGGISNVQYQIWTSPDNTVTSTNWYYWNRAYPLKEFVVFNHLATTNQAASKPQRFFQIRGVLPD
jgi:hypothetical protein